MDTSFADSFSFEMLLQWFKNAPTEDLEYAEVVLYDPETRANIYHACYSEDEDGFMLYEVIQWDKESDGTIIPTVIDEIENFATLADLCHSIIHIAKKQKLLPQLGVFHLDTDED